MPFPFAPVITGGASLLGGVLNNAFTQGANRRNERFAREMYDKQKADNISFFNMQNEYNSPAAQMARLKSAGLNPNLVYGASAPGNSSAGISSAAQPHFKAEPMSFDMSGAAGGALNAYYDTRIKDQQLSNLKTQNDVLQADAALKSANTLKSATEARYRTPFADNAVKFADESLRHLMYKIELTRQDAMFAQGTRSDRELAVQKQVENLGLDTLIKRQVLQGKTADNVLKNLQIELQRNGINPSDPTWIRVLGRLIAPFFDLKSLMK